ncbi:MAG: hypothetical protein J6039_03065 [Alphaproteobacteria bacterium]|nr:hypothetical protein [Alphaproteobacteria bacterium]
MFDYALRFLRLQYEQCLDLVSGNDFYTLYANEKWRHSLQVSGAGNYLLKRINFLKDKSEQYIDMLKSAILLHDFCRFSEIAQAFHGKKSYDHGVAAAKFLEYTPLFDDIRIRLPIKHHGHLMEDLYKDEEYQNLPQNLQNEVEKICFIIRDADKIANLNLFTHEEEYRILFFGYDNYRHPQYGKISEEIRKHSDEVETLPRFANASVADRLAGLVSWYLDINYAYSLDYCTKTNSTDIIFKMFADLCQDKEFAEHYSDFVLNYLQNHEFLR